MLWLQTRGPQCLDAGQALVLQSDWALTLHPFESYYVSANKVPEPCCQCGQDPWSRQSPHPGDHTDQVPRVCCEVYFVKCIVVV